MGSILESIQLIQIINFITAVNEKSFFAAAEKLNTTQPAVSKSISRLEETLGFPLFIREQRGSRVFREVRLTDKGEYLYTHWQEALNDLEDAYLHVQSDSLTAPKTLRVAIPTTVNISSTLWDVLNHYQQMYPFVSYDVGGFRRAEILKRLHGGKCEIVILPDFICRSLPRDKMDFEYIALGQAHVLLNKDNPLAERESLSMEDIQNELFINCTYEETDSWFSVYRDFFARLQIDPPMETIAADEYNLPSVIAKHPHAVYIIDDFFDLNASPYATFIKKIPLEGYCNGLICAWMKNRNLNDRFQQFANLFPDFSEIFDLLEPIVDIYQ